MRNINLRTIHFYIYYVGLILIGLSLFFSYVTLSISIISIFVNWLLEGQFREKWRRFKSRRSLWIFLSFFIVHLAGLAFTEDIRFGLHYTQLKLPMFIIPLVVATSKDIDFTHLKILLYFIIAGAVVSGLITLAVFLEFTPIKYHDIRNISIFISHIRLSLLLNMAVFIGLYFILHHGTKPKERLILSGSVFFLLFILFILKALTGIIVLLITIWVLMLVFLYQQQRVPYRRLLIAALYVLPVLVFGYIGYVVSDFYDVHEEELHALEEKTENDNRYKHFPNEDVIENGHYVYIYLCNKELKKEWNERSEIPFKGKDALGNHIRFTLYRYMTSLGLRKDSAGMAALKDEDIAAVESGKTNHIFNRKFSLYPKIYEVVWQIDRYLKGENPIGHSVTLRILYLNTAFDIIKDHFWTGVGTGDIQKAYNNKYKELDYDLDKKYWRRAHNQFVTFFVLFGLPGFLWMLVVFFAPPLMEKKFGDYFFLVFFCIAYLSMLNEDTIETHVGNSFFAFFFALFMYGYSTNKHLLPWKKEEDD